MNSAIKKSLIFLLVCFTLYAGYLVYLTFWRGPVLSRDNTNPRSWILENRVVRGGIYDRGGEKLVESIEEGGKTTRHYLYGPAYANITGYDSRLLGKVGLEQTYNSELLGLSGSLFRSLEVRWGVKGIKGNDIYLTIDHRLQEKASELLGNRKGAVVALNPQTGEILAMVSTPSFDPNTNNLETNWEQIRNDPGHSLLNRATQGLYPPGSTMKIVTASLGLKKFPNLASEIYNCQGEIHVQGRILKDLGVHGQLDLKRALEVSCNSYYATLGIRIGATAFASGLQEFGWGKAFHLEIPVQSDPLPGIASLTPNGLAESAIGQGKILVTPLSMALIAGSIGNNGVLMQPYLAREIRSPDGQVLWTAKPRPLINTTSPQIAARVREAMVGVVTTGTGTTAALPGIEVAGKTGSAENPEGNPHAWFISFAPASNPRIAVCVLVEHGGQGGRVAAPIARELMRLALQGG